MRWRIPILLTLVAFVAVSCDQQPLETSQQPTTTGLTFNIANAPPQSGIVVRADYTAASLFVDPESGLGALLGVDPVEFCTGPAEFDFVSFQTAIQRDGRQVDHGMGEWRAFVYPFTTFDCGLFLTVEPLATGMATVVSTDNDLYGIAPGDKNANAWGQTGHGTLVTPGGESVQFSFKYRARYNNSQGYKEVVKVSLH
jgi:hypothetical protein